MDKVPMTAKGKRDLEEELRHLRYDERPAIIKDIAVAREHGDLKENAEYHAARERQSFVEGRLKELEGIISHAEVIDPSQFSGDAVRFGGNIILADEDTDEEFSYQIVGANEANISTGLLSCTSPLAQALMGKLVGDTVEVTAPGGSKSYEIVEVKFG